MLRKRVRVEREDRGWSQTDLSKRLADNGVHMPSTVISKVELGERALRIEEVAGLADLFGMSVDALLGRTRGLPTQGLRILDELSDTAGAMADELEVIQGRWGRAFGALEDHFGRLYSYQEHACDAPWQAKDKSDDYRRAVLMRLCRDEALWYLHGAIGEIRNVQEIRHMSDTELPRALRAAARHIAQMKREMKRQQEQEQEQEQ